MCCESRYNGVIFLTNTNCDEEHHVKSDGFIGAFVPPTKAGFYGNGIMSFDFNSLYPNCIMSVNISPETLVGKIIDKQDGVITIRKPNGKKIEITQESLDKVLEEKCSIAGNDAIFVKSTKKWGIIPSFLDKLYAGRVAIKKEMKKNKKLAKECDDKIKQLLKKEEIH